MPCHCLQSHLTQTPVKSTRKPEIMQWARQIIKSRRRAGPEITAVTAKGPASAQSRKEEQVLRSIKRSQVGRATRQTTGKMDKSLPQGEPTLRLLKVPQRAPLQTTTLARRSQARLRHQRNLLAKARRRVSPQAQRLRARACCVSRSLRTLRRRGH